jgi:hypothetical protein
MAGAFSADQKRRMEDVSGEFRLEESGEEAWSLTPVAVFRLEHADYERQPGEPTHTSLEFENPGETQALGFILTAQSGPVSGISIDLDGRTLTLPTRLGPGQHLVYRGGDTATIRSDAWQIVRSLAVDFSAWRVAGGAHSVQFTANVGGTDEARAKLELRLDGRPEPLVVPAGD